MVQNGNIRADIHSKITQNNPILYSVRPFHFKISINNEKRKRRKLTIDIYFFHMSIPEDLFIASCLQLYNENVSEHGLNS